MTQNWPGVPSLEAARQRKALLEAPRFSLTQLLRSYNRDVAEERWAVSAGMRLWLQDLCRKNEGQLRALGSLNPIVGALLLGRMVAEAQYEVLLMVQQAAPEDLTNPFVDFAPVDRAQKVFFVSRDGALQCRGYHVLADMVPGIFVLSQVTCSGTVAFLQWFGKTTN